MLTEIDTTKRIDFSKWTIGVATMLLLTDYVIITTGNSAVGNPKFSNYHYSVSMFSSYMTVPIFILSIVGIIVLSKRIRTYRKTNYRAALFLIVLILATILLLPLLVLGGYAFHVDSVRIGDSLYTLTSNHLFRPFDEGTGLAGKTYIFCQCDSYGLSCRCIRLGKAKKLPNPSLVLTSANQLPSIETDLGRVEIGDLCAAAPSYFAMANCQYFEPKPQQTPPRGRGTPAPPSSRG